MKNLARIVGAVVFGGIAFAGAANAATNYITNGALDNPANAPHDRYSAINGAPPAWTTPDAAQVLTTNPQVIFNFTQQYEQIQTSTVGTIEQTVTLPGGDFTLSMLAAVRNDGYNTWGYVFLDLVSGGNIITPSETNFPVLSATPQTFSETFTNLSAGSYTVEVGGVAIGAVFQAGVADVSLTAGVPEPSTWAMMLCGFAGLGFAGYRQRKNVLAAAAA